MAEDENGGGERTEEASARKLQKAAQEGQVALSREAVQFTTLLVASLGAAIMLPGRVADLAAAMAGGFARAHELDTGWAAREWGWLFFHLAWPVAGAAILGAVLATLLQTRAALNFKGMVPNLSKLSPFKGFGRMFGKDGLMEFLRTLLKMLIVMAALWLVARDLPGLSTLIEAPPGALFGAAGHGVARLLAATLAAFALLALADILWVRHRHLERLKMTKQEVKDEAKESEGDPAIRGRLRQLRESKGRARMMAAVPKAAVVITNPTHYAVALAYDPGQSAAPKIVAKGVDAVAARIREVAKEAGVPIMADPPLARALHRLDLDAEIPAQHWDAVARIIALVMRRAGGAAPS